MRIEQAHFGYEAGHGRLGSSVELTGAELRVLEGLSDLSGYLDPSQRFDSYDMGYPCGRWYALTRTWPDVANRRPGTVYTHALLLRPEQVAKLEDPASLANVMRFLPIAERSRSMVTVEVTPSAPSEPVISEAESRRVVWSWFGSATRPMLVFEDASRVVRWLWRRLPPWGRGGLSWCTYTLRPRNLEARPIDIQGVAPGARGAFAHISVSVPPSELRGLEPLLDPAKAREVWRAAELHGFKDANPLLWVRLLERDLRADDSYPDALGALDLLAPVPWTPGPQEGLRARIVDRLLTRSRQTGSLRELSDLMVRDVDRVFPGTRERVTQRLAELLAGEVSEAAEEDLSLLIRSALRGGYGATLDPALEGLLARRPRFWEVVWEARPELAARCWAKAPSRALARSFRDLSGPAREAVLARVPEDDLLWWAFQDDPQAQERATTYLNLVANGSADWDEARELRLPPALLAELVLQWSAPPWALAVAAARQIADSAEAIERLEPSFPAWLIAHWFSGDVDSLARLLQRSSALRVAARDQLPEHRWPALLDATPNAEVLSLSPPSSVVARWLDRAAPLAAKALLAGDLDDQAFLALLVRAPRQGAVEVALRMVAVERPDEILALLLRAEARTLRIQREIVLGCVTEWGQRSRRTPEKVLLLLSTLRAESMDAWEAACSGALAAVLTRPAAELGTLAAVTLPVLHSRLCEGRGEEWLVRQLENIWGGYWDRAGRIRERYARAWLDAGWPTSNLVDAAGGDRDLLDKLGREVRWFAGGRRELEVRRGDVGFLDMLRLT